MGKRIGMNHRFLIASLFIVVFGITSNSDASFTTLSKAQAYAEAHPEYVKPSNKDWIHPNFQSFHKNNQPNWFTRSLSWFGLFQKKFNVSGFKKLLESIVVQREKEAMKGDFGEQFKSNVEDHFIIWGDLFSAFHSLVRDLTYLKKEGIIDDSLKIIKPQYHFVFNGNVVNGSPYILETLELVLQLMKANPSRVFYTKGPHEMEERWYNFGLIHELKIRGRASSSELIPFEGLINRFFNSLPIALYLTRENKDTIEVVLISNNENATRLFNKDKLSNLLSNKNKRGFFAFGNNRAVSNQSKKEVVLEAFITSEDRSISYHATEGLTRVGTFEGAVRWMVFSSPTERNQVLYKFFYDAFADLRVANGVSSWTIVLFNQKIPELNGFKEVAVYNLVTGQEIFTQEKRKKELALSFGATMDLSKGASPIGKKVQEGLRLAFDRELATNSVPGVIPQLTTVDDEYTPPKTRAAVQEFIKDGITLLIGSQGSASLESYLDLVRQREVLVMFPFSGSPLFRKPDLKNMIHYRGSYIREGEELIKYALRDLKAKKIAIFYQDDAFGRGALEGARRALKDVGITDVIEIPHERNLVNYKTQIEILTKENPDTILFSSNTPAIRGLIRQLGVQYFAGKKLLGLSVYEDAFERFLKDKGLEFVLVRMVPDPNTSTLQIAKEYREWADKRNVSYDKVSFEQYINANILFQILRKIEGPINKESIIAVAENLKDYPFKGLVLNFNPETRELSDTLWIDPGEGAWIERRQEKIFEPSEPIEEEKPKIVSDDKAVLRYGSTVDLSRGLKSQGRAVKEGIKLRLDEAHAQGVKLIPEIVIVDDGYTPEKTRKEVEKFIRQGIHTVVCPTGSPTLESYISLIKDGRVTVLFPITGAPRFRKRDLTNIINLRASYATEGQLLTEYAIDTLKTRKLALFYQNDAFGRGLLDAAVKVLQEKEIKEFLKLPYERNAVDFKNQVQRLKQFDPEAILFFSTTIAARSLIRQMGIQYARNKKLLGNSDFGELQFKNFVEETGLPFIYVNVVPNPKSSELPIVKQFRDAAQKDNSLLDTFSLESYIGVDLLLHVLQKIEKPVTRQRIIAELSSMKGINYKGLFLKFDLQTRTLLHSLWFNTGKPEWEKIDLVTGNKTG